MNDSQTTVALFIIMRVRTLEGCCWAGACNWGQILAGAAGLGLGAQDAHSLGSWGRLRAWSSEGLSEHPHCLSSMVVSHQAWLLPETAFWENQAGAAGPVLIHLESPRVALPPNSPGQQGVRTQPELRGGKVDITSAGKVSKNNAMLKLHLSTFSPGAGLGQWRKEQIFKGDCEEGTGSGASGTLACDSRSRNHCPHITARNWRQRVMKELPITVAISGRFWCQSYGCLVPTLLD